MRKSKYTEEQIIEFLKHYRLNATSRYSSTATIGDAIGSLWEQLSFS